MAAKGTPHAQVDQSVIITDGLEALATMRWCIDVLHTRRAAFVDKGEPKIINDGEITKAIRDLCTAQARAFNCLFDNGVKRSSEGSAVYGLRIKRVAEFRSKCGEIALDALSNRTARNGIVHFEEKYLKAVLEKPIHLMLRYLAISHSSMLKRDDRPVLTDQVYSYDNDTIYVLDGSLNVAGLSVEIDRIASNIGIKFVAKN